jgi:hypothetical protein
MSALNSSVAVDVTVLSSRSPTSSQHIVPRWADIFTLSIIVRLTFTISVGCMKPNLQGLTWFEYREISKEEPLRIFKFLLLI